MNQAPSSVMFSKLHQTFLGYVYPVNNIFCNKNYAFAGDVTDVLSKTKTLAVMDPKALVDVSEAFFKIRLNDFLRYSGPVKVIFVTEINNYQGNLPGTLDRTKRW